MSVRLAGVAGLAAAACMCVAGCGGANKKSVSHTLVVKPGVYAGTTARAGLAQWRKRFNADTNAGNSAFKADVSQLRNNLKVISAAKALKAAA